MRVALDLLGTMGQDGPLVVHTRGSMRRPRGHGTTAAASATIAAVVIALLGLGGGVASAQDEAPPRTLVMTHASHQDGELYASYWATRDGQFCTVVSQDGFATFTRTGPKFRPGQAARVVMVKSERPAHLELWYWKQIDGDGHPVGEQTALRYRLLPIEIGGRATWEARFLPPSIAKAYVNLLGYWWDQEGCDILQDAAWTYTISRST
jgi:hypothetical protein